jgi:hypothetical protein
MFHRPGARLAYCNWDNLNVAERLLRLAFKAQTQSRVAVEAVGVLKNPGLVIARSRPCHSPANCDREASHFTRWRKGRLGNEQSGPPVP